jgi:hypothetical protein
VHTHRVVGAFVLHTFRRVKITTVKHTIRRYEVSPEIKPVRVGRVADGIRAHRRRASLGDARARQDVDRVEVAGPTELVGVVRALHRARRVVLLGTSGQVGPAAPYGANNLASVGRRSDSRRGDAQHSCAY